MTHQPQYSFSNCTFNIFQANAPGVPPINNTQHTCSDQHIQQHHEDSRFQYLLSDSHTQLAQAPQYSTYSSASTHQPSNDDWPHYQGHLFMQPNSSLQTAPYSNYSTSTTHQPTSNDWTHDIQQYQHSQPNSTPQPNQFNTQLSNDLVAAINDQDPQKYQQPHQYSQPSSNEHWYNNLLQDPNSDLNIWNPAPKQVYNYVSEIERALNPARQEISAFTAWPEVKAIDYSLHFRLDRQVGLEGKVSKSLDSLELWNSSPGESGRKEEEGNKEMMPTMMSAGVPSSPSTNSLGSEREHPHLRDSEEELSPIPAFENCTGMTGDDGDSVIEQITSPQLSESDYLGLLWEPFQPEPSTYGGVTQ